MGIQEVGSLKAEELTKYGVIAEGDRLCLVAVCRKDIAKPSFKELVEKYRHQGVSQRDHVAKKKNRGKATLKATMGWRHLGSLVYGKRGGGPVTQDIPKGEQVLEQLLLYSLPTMKPKGRVKRIGTMDYLTRRTKHLLESTLGEDSFRVPDTQDTSLRQDVPLPEDVLPLPDDTVDILLPDDQDTELFMYKIC